MPLHCFNLKVFDYFSYSSHFLIQINLLELEKCLCHFLLFPILHVDINQKQTKCYRPNRYYNQSDSKIWPHTYNCIRPLLITFSKPISPCLHNTIKVVLNLFLILCPFSVIWCHKYPIQRRWNLDIKHVESILCNHVPQISFIIKVLIPQKWWHLHKSSIIKLSDICWIWVEWWLGIDH